MMLGGLLLAGAGLIGMGGEPLDLISPSDQQAIIEHEQHWQPRLPQGGFGYEGISQKEHDEAANKHFSIQFNEGISLLDALDTLIHLKGYKIRYERGVVLNRGLGAVSMKDVTWGEALDVMAKVGQINIEDIPSDKMLIIRDGLQ